MDEPNSNDPFDNRPCEHPKKIGQEVEGYETIEPNLHHSHPHIQSALVDEISQGEEPSKFKGTINKLKGTIQTKTGELFGNEELEGKGRRVKGKGEGQIMASKLEDDE